MVWNPFYPNRDGSRLSNVKILITLPDGEGCVRSEQFLAEDLRDEDVVGHVLGFNLWQQMAACRSQAALILKIENGTARRFNPAATGEILQLESEDEKKVPPLSRLNSNKGTKSDIEIAPAERGLGQIQFVLF